MSKPPLLYAKLPQFKYQTFDLETLKFSDVPVIPIYENVGTVGDDKVNADIESNKDKGPDDPSVTDPSEPVPELSNGTCIIPPSHLRISLPIFLFLLLLFSFSFVRS